VDSTGISRAPNRLVEVSLICPKEKNVVYGNGDGLVKSDTGSLDGFKVCGAQIQLCDEGVRSDTVVAVDDNDCR
jgi:hypothetical protein